MAETSSLLRNGTMLGDRYRIIGQIGQGGFGRTYLAEDTHRYYEQCVLKEFAPQVSSDRDLQKAEELFNREAGILYQLKNERIPRFEALLKTRVDGRNFLFLVQEYIKGKTYWDLLKSQGKLSETEVIELILELLPVLEYIHSQGVIHRDISPDNLIRRHSDGKPVLIDFGCVKIAANEVSRSTGQSVTLIGKKGYAPEEQMQSGKVYPNSDFYALAATVLVLLTGKLPDELYNAHDGTWHWQTEISMSSGLAKVLTKMLAHRPDDRYQNVEKIVAALNSEPNPIVNNIMSRLRTLIIAPRANTNQAVRDSDHDTPISEPFTQISQRITNNISRINTQTVNISRQVTQLPYIRDRNLKSWQWGLIIAAVILIPGMGTFALVKGMLPNKSANIQLENSTVEKDREKQKEIYRRAKVLYPNEAIFYEQVDRIFRRQYPEFKGSITDKPEHQKYRQAWYKIAEQLLEKQENKL